MYDNNKKSNLFNFDPSIVALILWIISILGVSAWGGILLIVGCLYILKNERQSDFLRSHVSQILALAIVSTIVAVAFRLLSVLFLLRFFSPIYVLLSTIIGLVIFALALLGALKAFNKEEIKLPLIGFIGEEINTKVRPD